MFPVALTGRDFDGGVVLAVVERELRAQQQQCVVALALAVAQKAPDLALAHRVLLDGRSAEEIVLAAVELKENIGLVGRQIHLHLAAHHACIEITVGGRGARQAAFVLIVVRVAQALATVQRRGGGQTLEYLILRPWTVDLHADAVDQHRHPGVDRDLHMPVLVLVGTCDGGGHHRFVVAVGAQRRAQVSRARCIISPRRL